MVLNWKALQEVFAFSILCFLFVWVYFFGILLVFMGHRKKRIEICVPLNFFSKIIDFRMIIIKPLF